MKPKKQLNSNTITDRFLKQILSSVNIEKNLGENGKGKEQG